MPPFDDMSRALGSLEAAVEELSRQARSLFERADDAALRTKAVEVRLEQMTESLSAIRNDLAALRQIKDRGMGVVLALSLLAGGIGATATKLISVIK